MTEGTEKSTPVTSGEDLRLDDPDLPPELPLVVEAALERHARDPVILDLRGISDATDFFFILSGDSDVHTRSIAENLVQRLEESGFEPVGIEGRSAGRWILLDYVDVVVHVFLPRVREFYRLEQLWGDAPRATVQE
jgi:ribosome-associated protein